MSVWDKIKGALIEEDPAKQVSAPPAPMPSTLPPTAGAESAEAAYASPRPDPYYTQQPDAAVSPTLAYMPPSPSPVEVTPSPVVTPSSPRAAFTPNPAASPAVVVSPSPEPRAAGVPPSPAIGSGVRVSPKATPSSTPALAVNMEQILALYQEAGIPQPQYSAEQALRFLNTLSADQSLASRRSALLGLVDSLCDNFPGLSSESLIEDARVKIVALEAGRRESYGEV